MSSWQLLAFSFSCMQQVHLLTAHGGGLTIRRAACATPMFERYALPQFAAPLDSGSRPARHSASSVIPGRAYEGLLLVTCQRRNHALI